MTDNKKTTKEIIEGIKEKVSIVEKTNNSNNGINEIVSNVKRLISRKMLVPIICEDMYEFQDPVSKKRQSLHSYIVEKIIEKSCNINQNIRLTEAELEDIVNEGYYGMSLLQSKYGKDLYIDIYNSIMDEDNSVYEGICLKEEVVSFLKACDFQLIITTSCFPILEKELGDKYNSYWNEIEERNNGTVEGHNNMDMPERCIYHLFGEAKLGNSNWGYNEKQILRFLRFAYSDYPLSNLTKRINDNMRKTLLFLGNDCPDWLFRFILTPIYGGDVYDDGKGFYMNADCRDEDCRLNHFLDDIKFDKESQLICVLKEVTKKVRDANLSVSTSHGKKYDFFIAHAGEDKDDAKELVNRMRNNGLVVWVDYENIIDGYYWQRIIDAIKDSAYFMPFVTGRYIFKNKERKDVKNAFEKLNISDVSIDMEECLRLESFLDGVQIELLLSSKWYKTNKRELYSIPVIQKGSSFYGEQITTTRIKNWSYESKILPQSLFWGLQMYEFDASNPHEFVLDWKKYK
jgi:hypothetical protein